MGVQRGGQAGDERAERVPVRGTQVLVVDVDARVPVRQHQRHDAGHLLPPQGRVVQHARHRRVGPLARGDVGQGGDHRQPGPAQPCDGGLNGSLLNWVVLGHDPAAGGQPVDERRDLGEVLPVGQHRGRAVADVPERQGGDHRPGRAGRGGQRQQGQPGRHGPGEHHGQPGQAGQPRPAAAPGGTGAGPLGCRASTGAIRQPGDRPGGRYQGWPAGLPSLVAHGRDPRRHMLMVAAVSWSSMTAPMMSSSVRAGSNPTRPRARVQSGTRRCMSS